VRIEDLAEDGAGALVACVERCYGDTYPEALFARASRVAEALREGRLVSKVAVCDDGRIVGHLGTRFPFPGDRVAETVGGVVDPAYRGRGLLRALGRAMAEVYRQRELAGIRLFATGAHVRTQSLIVAASGRATGVLLGHIPAGTEYRGIDHGFGCARIGAVVFYQPLGAAPALDVYVPAPYRELARALHASLALERRLLEPGAAPCPGGERRDDPRRGVRLLRFGRLARGTLEPPERLLAELQRERPAIVYADLPLCDPGTPGLAARLREVGFYLGALLPGSEGSETLRLQRLPSSGIAPERIRCGSEQVSAQLESVLADRRAVEGPPA